MIAKTITLFALYFVCQLCTPGISAQQFSTANELVGNYVSAHNFGSSLITVNADGSFSVVSRNCTSSTEQSGTYVLSDGVLRFTVLTYTANQNGDDKDADLFDPQVRKGFLGYGDDEKIEPFKTTYSLLPVRWVERLYLLDEGELREFCNAINLGLEPRPRLESEPYYGSFYLRQGDQEKGISGKPSLPTEYMSFLLSKPVSAKVGAIEEDDKGKIAIINKGSQDGLKVGMKLVGMDRVPWLWSDEGLVLSVEDHTARVRVYELSVGDVLSSKYAPRDID